jgi:hypothetical protein
MSELVRKYARQQEGPAGLPDWDYFTQVAARVLRVVQGTDLLEP